MLSIWSSLNLCQMVKNNPQNHFIMSPIYLRNLGPRFKTTVVLNSTSGCISGLMSTIYSPKTYLKNLGPHFKTTVVLNSIGGCISGLMSTMYSPKTYLKNLGPRFKTTVALNSAGGVPAPEISSSSNRVRVYF